MQKVTNLLSEAKIQLHENQTQEFIVREFSRKSNTVKINLI